MKKVLFFLMMLVTLCLAEMVQAQDIVTIGTGTSAGYYPIPGFYGWQYDVYVYTPSAAEDLEDDFVVSQIAYDLTTSSATTGATMTIWMKDVDPDFTLASSNTFAQLTTGATQVYSNTSFTSTTGWNTYQFSQNFTHQGGKAILVAVLGTGCTTSGGCSRQCHYTSATGTHWYKHSDSSDPGTSATGTIDANRANIQIEVTPVGGVTCTSPTALAISDVTSSSATLSWTPRGGVTAWEVYVDTGNVDMTTVTGIPVSFDTSYTFTGLEPNTLYKAYVRSSCTSEYSNWKNVSFYTLCVPMTTLPMYENFDSWTAATSTSASENNLPNCWHHLSGTYSSYAGYPIIYTSSTNYAYSGANALRFYTYTGTSNDYGNQYAILPQVDGAYYPMNTLQLTMQMRKNSTSYTDFTLIVGVMSDPTDATTFVPVDTIANSTTTYEEYTVMFNNYTGIGEYVAFYAPKVTPSNVTYNTGYVDNIVLETIPTCLKPTDMTLSNVTASGVDVNWVPGDLESAWELVVVPAGDPVTSGFGEGATAYPYTISGLDDNTTYDVYLRADCGGGDYSSWVGPKTFTTNPLCTPPSNLRISQVAGTSALVSWSDAPIGANNYTLEYSEAGLDMWGSVTVNGTSYMLSSLNPQTSYDVRVFSNCDLSSADTLTGAFTTGCLVGGELQIGDGTTTAYTIPVNNYYHYTYSQQIFLASEMNGPQTISSVSFDYAYATAMTDKTNVNIYLCHTSQSSFATTSDFVPTTNMQLVYSGNLNCQQGWNTFSFTTPFQYDGVSNLVLAVDDNSDDYNGSSYTFHVNTATGTNRSLYYYSDSSNPDPTNLSAFSGNKAVSTNRNNVKFGGDCDSLTTCVRPNIYVSSKTDESITLEWVPGYMETSWDLEYCTDTANWIVVGAQTGMQYVLDNLASNTVYYVRIRSNCGGGDYSEWNTIEARTECGYITIPYMEGFESAPASGSGNMITCWSTLSNYTSSHYPYTSSSQKHSGTYSVYFYGTSSYYSYLISPPFDDLVQMNNLEISFWAYKTSASYYIQMGVMSDPEDPTTFVQMGQFSPSATSTWESFEATTASYTGNGHYIAFRIPNDITNYMYIDDINIDVIPTCPHVTNIQVDATTLTGVSADISWTPGSTESQWEYVVAPANTVTNPENELSTTVYTASASLTNLIANTLYDIFVRANCAPGDNSRWEKFTFRTACDAITSLPFVEDFDTYGTGSDAWMDCWTKVRTYTASTTLPYVGTGGGADGSTAYLYFYSNTSGTYTMAVTPPFDSSIPINTLRARFKYKGTNSNDEMIVGVLTDPEDGTTFVPVDTVSVPSTGTWMDRYVDFNSYTGTGHYIGFMCMYHTTSTYSRMDNLVINTIPNCLEPTHFMVDNMDQTSASFTWNSTGVETEWELYVVPSGASLDTVAPTMVYDTFATVVGLNAATSYDAYIRTVCSGSGGYSDYAITHFTTSCIPIDSLPFTENFDSYTGATSTSVSTNNLPTCWNNISGTYSSYAGYPIIYNSSTYAASGSNSMRFYLGTSTSYAYDDEYAILPPIDGNVYPINTLQLTMDVRKNSTSYADFTLVVGVMSNPLDTSTFVPVDTIVQNQTTYEEYTVYFANYTGNGNFIALCAPRYTPSNVSYNTGYVDNIVVDLIPSCPAPRNVSATAVTNNSIDLTWEDVSSGSASSWEVEYGTPGFTPGINAGIVLQAYTNSITLSGLTSNTSYEVYVKADCGYGDVSEYSSPVIVSTSCDLMTTLPFTENFDSHTAYTTTSASTSNLPDCWNNLSGTYSSYAGYPIIYYSSSTNYASSAPNAMRFYVGTTSSYDYGDEYAILPPIDESIYPINTLQLTMDVRKGSTSYTDFTLIVGVMSNPSDASTFVPVDTIAHNQTTYGEYTVYFNNYIGTGNYIALCAPKHTPSNVSYNTGYVDNLVLEVISSCPRPSDLHVTAVTNTSITLGWTEVGSASSWEIEYGAPGFTPGSGTTVQATTNPMTITALSPSTNYEFYVRSVCSASEMSNWSNAYVTATECDVMSVPYTEDFESYAGTTYSDNNGPVPTCWTTFSTNTTYGHPHVTGSGSYHYVHSGTNCLVFTTGSAGSDAYAMLPTFSQALNTLQVSFYYAMENPSYGTLTVGYVTNTGDPASSFVVLETITSIDGDNVPMDSIAMDLSSYPNVPANGNICFHWNHSSSFYSCCIDDISVIQVGSGPGPVDSCEVPQGLTVSQVDNTSATLVWSQTGENVLNWTMDYKKSTASTWTTVNNIVTPTVTLTNLEQNTQYDVRLAAVCGENNVSDYTPVLQFSTTNIGVNDYELGSSVSLYPNPNNGTFTIRDDQHIILSVQIYDVYGKLLRVMDVNDNFVNVDMSSLASGVYFARVITDKGEVNKQVVKK